MYCPFNLLWSFKDGAFRSKTYFIILSDTHALCNVHACLRPMETSFFTTRQIYACVYETPENFFLLVSKIIPTWCMLFRTRMHNACMSGSMLKSVLLRWTPSLNDRRKSEGQYTLHRCLKWTYHIMVGPSLNPTVSVKNKNLVLLSLYYLLTLRVGLKG